VKRIFCLTIILLMGYTFCFAQSTGFGMGIVLGEPTGLNFKLWLGGPSALDLGLAWAFFEPNTNTLQVYADYLFHFLDLFKLPANAGRLVLYFGAGGRILVFNTEGNLPLSLGVRIPVGLTYFIPNVPMDVFLEIVPIMALLPATAFQASAGLGVRFFFQ